MMDREAIKKGIASIIAEQLKKPVQDLKESDTLDSLGADSLDRVEIVMKLEEHFGIEINDEDAEKLQSTNQAIAYVEGLLKNKSN